MIIPRFLPYPRAGLEKTEYPVAGIAAAVAMLCLVPFTSSYLTYVAFILCAFRMFLYNAKVFATDLALLSSFYNIFRAPGGDSLLAYLLLLAAVWYFFLQRIKLNASLFTFAALFCYLLTRLGHEYNSFLLIIGSLLAMRSIISAQTPRHAVWICKAFCIGILITSVYALIFRNSPQFVAVRGIESPAIWGGSVMRFQGTLGDPNYYSVFLILSLCLLMRLWHCGHIRSLHFSLGMIALVVFGTLTYSKSFYIALVIIALLFFYILMLKGSITVTLFAILGVAVLGLSSAVTIISERFLSAGNLNQLTTGRLELFEMYLKLINESNESLFFGHSIGARLLYRGTHNIYLEICYYAGIIGLILYAAYISTLVVQVRSFAAHKDNFVFRYMSVGLLVIMYFALHGMLEPVFYIQFAVAMLSISIQPGEK